MVPAAMKLKDAYSSEGKKKSPDKTNSLLKSRDITLPTKVHIANAVIFPVVMYGCDYWTIKKALESPLDCKEIQPVYPKGDQP